MRTKHSPTARRLTLSLLVMAALLVGLCVTTYALMRLSVEISDNSFTTGKISIDLNGGRAVITEEEFIFEPGMTVEKPFYLKNNSTWPVYYKLYMENVRGGLATVLQVSILDKESRDVLYSGSPASLSRETLDALDDALGVGQKREFIIRFYFPPAAGNTAQNLSLSFNLSAEAVQTKNNDLKQFD